ncbi:WD40 repeat domain-containing protein [Chitinophaga tropicalis]|uniref:WD40 repeat domain-containing protein n=1 Tax=Chitinophaga tropicalis TaxID=2683588 RepID=A0A7K1U1U5_9BACT|nr:WD40 repeat domain-containing protein [Chitinophaga tropicalis]MVT08329.1 hypothetical protein [Chitinophaga tropicalis]
MELNLKNKAAVVSLAVSPDGKWLAIGQMVDEDLSAPLSIWNTDTWKCVATVEKDQPFGIRSLSFNRHSNRLAYVPSGWHEVRFFNMNDLATELEMGFQGASQVRYAANKDLLIVVSEQVSVLDNEDVEIFIYRDYKAYEHTEGLSPELFKDYYRNSEWMVEASYGNLPAVATFCKDDSAVIITGNNDNKFSVYDIESGKLIEQYPGGVIQAQQIEIDSQEKHLFLISRMPYADLLWELPSMKRLLPQYLNEDYQGSSCFAFHPSGKYFAIGGAGGKVAFRDLDTGKFLMMEDIHEDEVNALQFSKDGKLLISGSDDGKVFITDISEYLT